MFTLRAARAAAQRRAFTTTVNNVTYGRDFNTTWLGDKGAWPVLGVITGALVLCGGFITHKVAFHPDVRITGAKRASDIRTWK